MVWAAVLESRLVTSEEVDRRTATRTDEIRPRPPARACNFYLRDVFYRHGLRPASRHFSEPNRRRHEVDLAIGGRCGTAESWRVVRARRCAARPHRAPSAIYVSCRAWCRPAAPYLAYGACVAGLAFFKRMLRIMLATVRDARASMFLITLSYGAPKHLEAPRRRPTALKARAAPISFFPFLGHTPKKKPTFPNQPHGIRHYKMERKQRSSLVWSGNARRAAKHEYFL
eukprot:scaffold20328_cov39-Phaeocystis_antarctica.AAC.1